jgi:hypothetical protein
MEMNFVVKGTKLAPFYCTFIYKFNPLKAELNPICHLLALLGAHHIFHVSRIRVNLYCFLIKEEDEVIFICI